MDKLQNVKLKELKDSLYVDLENHIVAYMENNELRELKPSTNGKDTNYISLLLCLHEFGERDSLDLAKFISFDEPENHSNLRDYMQQNEKLFEKIEDLRLSIEDSLYELINHGFVMKDKEMNFYSLTEKASNQPLIVFPNYKEEIGLEEVLMRR